MITNDSLKEYYTKLHGMYIQCYDMMKAMNQSLTTKDSEISLVVVNSQGERETIKIPSYLYLENKIEQLDSSLSSLIELPESGEAWLQKNADLYKIDMVKHGISPEVPSIKSTNLVALYKDNNFLKDLVSPKTYLKIDISNMSDITSSMMMKKLIIYDADMFSALQSYNSYDEISAALYNYSKGSAYDEYDNEIEVPVKRNRFTSSFNITSIPTKEEVGKENPWTESSSSKLTYEIKLDTLEYYDSEDQTIVYSLNTGDLLTMAGQSTIWKVKSVDDSDMTVVIEEVSGHTALQTHDENSSMSFTIYDNNFSAYHYVEVPLEENQYIIVFLASIRNNTRSAWSSPIICDLSSIYVKDNGGNYIQDEYGNNLTYIEYYKKYCTNVGDLILGITQTAYPQISNFTSSQLESLQDGDGIQKIVSNTFDVDNILQVVPINKHLVDTTTNDDIKSLHASKNDFMQQISSKQSEIDDIYNKLITTDFSKDITVSQSQLKTKLNTLYTEKTSLQKQLNSIIDDISTKSTNLDITGNEIKYRVRGVTDTTYLDRELASVGDGLDIEAIGCEVEYKYKSTTKENTSLSSINSSTFTDWNRLDNIDRQRKLKFTTSGVGVEFVDYGSTDNIIKWNQIDIPIQQGEDVVIRVRYKLNIGQPFISIYTPWSDEKTVVFPSQYKNDIDLTTILTQNDQDSVSAAFSKTLIDDGYQDHIQDKVVSSDQVFFHNSENIYSGFNTSENKMISLKDKLNDLNNKMETWKTTLDNETNSKFEVYLNYDEYSVLLSPNSKNTINLYNNDHITNMYIKKNMNIVIKNTGDTRVNLYSIFPGSTDISLLNCEVSSFIPNIANYERVPLIIDNAIKGQTLGQWIYFRENSSWTGQSIYFSSESQNQKDEKNIEEQAPLVYECNANQYMGVDNMQVLLGYRSRSGSTHQSTIAENSTRWGKLMFDFGKKEASEFLDPKDIDMEEVPSPSLITISTDLSAQTGESMYAKMANSDSSWFIYGLTRKNSWIMRYEDIVKTSSESTDAIESYLDPDTTFDSFLATGSATNFTSVSSFTGGFLYPELISKDQIITEGEEKSSKYIEVGESISIPVVFEYFVDSSMKNIKKSLYFDLRNSLVKDPQHYMIEIVGNYDFSSQNMTLYTNDGNFRDAASDAI